MNEKKLVSVILDENGKCEQIAEVRNLDTKAFNKCVNEERAYREEKQKIEKERDYAFMTLSKNCDNHKAHTKQNDVYLAKALYDNFVDRGLLNDNEDFQKDFFNHIYKGADLDLNKAPTEFITILRKVELKDEEK